MTPKGVKDKEVYTECDVVPMEVEANGDGSFDCALRPTRIWNCTAL